jgi:hypothetical protein
VTRVQYLVLTAVMCLFPVLAYGQGGDSGSINGYVFDQAGTPLKGVKVSASSPTQIGGAKTTYTGEDGSFRLRSLIPGQFEVNASAPKLRTVVQKGVKVGITSAVELNLIMDVETATEQVTIKQTTPLVSTTKPNVAEEFDTEFVEALPHHARDNIHRDMVGSVAGSVANRMRGGAANQTIVTQDGFDMGPPGKTISPTLKSSAAFEIQTGGYAGDNPTASGGILNLVTRSGSNKFEFEFNATGENNALQFFRDERDPRSDTFYYVLNPTIAGPIIKDKLWFFFNTETHLTQDGKQRDVEGIFPDPLPTQRYIQKGSIKLTWQASSRNKLSLITNYELIWERDRVGGVGIDAQGQEDRNTQRIFLGTIWESVLTDNLIMRNQLGATFLPEHIFPARCRDQKDTCDQIPSVQQTFPRAQRLDNATNHTRTDLYGLQLVTAFEYFLSSPSLGEHNFQLKNRFYTEQEIKRASHTGDRLYELNGQVPLALTTFYSNDPRREPERYGWFIGSDTVTRDVVTLTDTWRPTRHLTVTPALSYAWGKGGTTGGDTVIDAATWAPGLSAVWDATHDGRTALRASASNYVDMDIGAVARHTIGSQAQQRCLWNPATNAYDLNCVYSGGSNTATIGSPCGPDGIDQNGNSCRQKLQVPRTWEVTAGGEREITSGIGVSLDFVHRTFNNQYEVNETNRIWNPAGTKLDTIGGYRNGRPETINDLETPDGAQRRYDGITLGVNKREGRLKANFSYTVSWLRGTVAGGTGNAWGDIPARDVYLDGYLPDDHRHEFKLSASYQATPWLSFGTRTTYLSGFPYDRLFLNEVTSGYDQYRTTRGLNPGTDVNDPADDRELRLPDQMEVNFQARVNLLPFIGQRLDLYVDVLNSLAIRSALTVGTNDGTDFGVQRTWMDPFRIRLGVNYKF